MYYATYHTPITLSLWAEPGTEKDHRLAMATDAPPSGGVLAAIVNGEFPFFAEENARQDINKAEIARFIARHCEGRCVLDPVAIPAAAVRTMTRWEGLDIHGYRSTIGAEVPDWASSLREWILSGQWDQRGDGGSLSEREYKALRQVLRSLSGAPFDLGERVRNMTARGWGPNDRARFARIIGLPLGRSTYALSLAAGSPPVFALEEDMQKWDKTI